MGDIDDPFLPLPAKKLQMNVEKDREQIDILLDKLYNSYGVEDLKGTKTNQNASKNCAGSAIKTAICLLSENKGGRLLLFSGTITQLGCGAV